jgi:sulfur carrier protein ThiS
VKIKVKLSRINKTKEIQLKKGSTIENLLEKLNLKPDTLIILSNNVPIPVDSTINNNQEITIVQVSSGG